jgi:hypothetical protein
MLMCIWGQCRHRLTSSCRPVRDCTAHVVFPFEVVLALSALGRDRFISLRPIYDLSSVSALLCHSLVCTL